MDSTACNYNIDATQDDTVCTYPETNYDCENNCIATADACGTCGGTIENTADCCPESQVPDCAGVCDGTAAIDCNGDCGGSAVEDCAGTCDGSALLIDEDCTNISYTATIQPIFNTNCTSCHGGLGGLNLGSYSTLMSGGNSGTVIIFGNGSGSLLVKKLRGTAGTQMPKNQTPLNDTTINLIETWIDEGALEEPLDN